MDCSPDPSAAAMVFLDVRLREHEGYPMVTPGSDCLGGESFRRRSKSGEVGVGLRLDLGTGRTAS